MTGAISRTATLSEVALMLDWAAEEGWNPGQEDAEAFHAADPEGFFVAEADGRPVAAISVVNHSDKFSFLGLYLCRPEFRGRGIGFALWTHALSHAGERTIGLDGVPAQEANYAKSGFVATGCTRRLRGSLPASALVLPEAADSDIGAIAELDREATGSERPDFLKEWTRLSATRRTVLLADKSGVTGFATARLCRDGCKIGPIVAPTADDAVGLAVQAAASLKQTDVIVDVPGSRPEFERLLQKRGFTEVFTTARMYRGPVPRAGPGLRAIATMELG